MFNYSLNIWIVLKSLTNCRYSAIYCNQWSSEVEIQKKRKKNATYLEHTRLQ